MRTTLFFIALLASSPAFSWSGIRVTASGPGSIAGQSIAPSAVTATGDIIGNNFVAKGTSTVQGNAFSVNTQDLAVSGGKVGIGTASPLTPLDVNGASSLRGPVTDTSSMTVNGQDASGYSIYISSGIKVTGNVLLNGSNGLVGFPSNGCWYNNSTDHTYCYAGGTLMLTIANGTVTIGAGGNTVYRCATAGAVLPAGTLTTNATACGTTADTGLRTP